MRRSALLLSLLAACSGTSQPSGPTATTCPPCDCTTAAAEPIPPGPTPEPPDEPEGVARVAAGTCDVSFMPAGLVEDLSDAESAALVTLVQQWLSGDPGGPRVDAANGIRHAKSEDDSGADPPYPSWTRAQSSLVCGAPSLWLASHVRETFAMHAEIDPDGVRCQENVCCHDGMEFVSNGWIVFRRETGEGGTGFVLHTAAEAAVAALGEEYAAANRTYVGRELGRLERRRCAGEPARVAR